MFELLLITTYGDGTAHCLNAETSRKELRFIVVQWMLPDFAVFSLVCVASSLLAVTLLYHLLLHFRP